uniref:hypothetical protein n=1 Tax=Nocardia suismassiliense TaxID=2077092 RepID=UPI0038993BD8
MDILVQSRRNAKAARRFLAKLMRKQCRVPQVLVTRQAPLLRSGAPGVDAVGGTPAVSLPQQPGRELPSTHPAT